MRNKVAYMDYGSTEEIPEDACSLRQCMETWQHWTDSVIKVLKIKH